MTSLLQKNGMNTLQNGNTSIQHNMNHEHEVHDVKYELCDGLEIKQEAGLPQDIQSDSPEIDIIINNVVCSFSVRCHLNLREIALNGTNVEYRRENGMVSMKMRRPYTTATIWSSGKVSCTGATSEDQAKIAARRFARSLQKLGFNIRFHNYRVVNVLGTCSMPFAIKINGFAAQHKEADYEPEIHPGVTYKLQNPRATLKIFSTGSVTVTARSVAMVQAAIEYIFPLVYEFRKERTQEEKQAFAMKKLKHQELQSMFVDENSGDNVW